VTPGRSLRAAAIVVSSMAILAAGCGSSSSGGAQTVTARTAVPRNANGCTAPPDRKPVVQHYSHEPPLTITRTTYTARIVTNCGTIVASLDGKDAPHTVNSFHFLAAKGYFTDTSCHRLVTTGIHVLQCGDPTGTGEGGPGYTIPDENLTGATYPTGTLAMANTGQPHTGGSQFFFVYGTTPLPPTYTPFGHVTAGLDVLQRIARAGSDDSNGAGDGHPLQPVVIESFTVTEG
jgi:peptidyl-prolyl cis-trans isomerase B (cyclophilin B)